MSFIHPDAGLMGSNGNVPSSTEKLGSKSEEDKSHPNDRIEIKIVMLKVQVIYIVIS
ncbi:hypothetical protein KR084_009324, partial [Drosophila pseudotakahashii]